MFGPALSMFEELLYHPKNGLMCGLRPILSYLCSSLEKETGKFHVLKLTKKKKKKPLFFPVLFNSLNLALHVLLFRFSQSALPRPRPFRSLLQIKSKSTWLRPWWAAQRA